MSQKKIFLETEGDAWLNRNAKSISAKKLPEEDPILLEIIGILPAMSKTNAQSRVLEIGCGNGYRLSWLQKELRMECYGIEPSSAAVAEAREQGLNVIVGTADELPFESGFFDLVIYGFCLYLCDRGDLFRISKEADRVLKPESWLVILDFFSPSPTANKYHHFEGIYSYKMDYRNLFLWHPHFQCHTHKVRDFHSREFSYTDIPGDMTAISIIRKYEQRPG